MKDSQNTPTSATDQQKRTSQTASENQDDPAQGIYAPPRRRSARRSQPQTQQQQERASPGLWGRITGRHRLEQIREERYKPYSYESNRQNIKWTTAVMAIWCVILIVLAFIDYSNVRTYRAWAQEDEIDSKPPIHEFWSQIENPRAYAKENGGPQMECAYLGGRDTTEECPNGQLPWQEIDQFLEQNQLRCLYRDAETDECTGVWTSQTIIDFAEAERLDCTTTDATFETFDQIIKQIPVEHSDCEYIIDIALDFSESQDRSRLVWLLVMISLIVVAFPYLSTIHRASRNLLTLNSEGQKDRPEWAVLHHFIPILNLFRPGRVVTQMFKASDPNVSTQDTQAWKEQGRTHPIAYIWWALWCAGLIFNPILLPRYISVETLQDIITLNTYFVYSDILLVALGIVAVLMLRQLHRMQEERHQKVGDITVTQPLPSDPLQDALREQEEARRKNQKED